MESCNKRKTEGGAGVGIRSTPLKRRFQLFDPAAKTDLAKLCEHQLVNLVVEKVKDEDTNSGAGNDNEENQQQIINLSDFEGSSSSEDEEDASKSSDSKVESQKSSQGTTGKGNRGLQCGTCNVPFASVTEQRQHYSLDWHRYNIKRKLHGQTSVTETKFVEMMDDLSSIDGSEDEDEDVPVERLLEKLETPSGQGLQKSQPQIEQIQLSKSQKFDSSPKMFFKNRDGHVLSCYKTIIMKEMNLSNSTSTENRTVNFLSCLKNPLKITIIMTAGGHFAAAVFEGNACTNHKTFHSYTVRAKQGGSQGSRDAKSGTSHPKSAGASLRRYNEQSFQQHVQDLLSSWKDSISQSDLIFYRAVSGNANSLFSGKNPPLQKDKANLRTIPFPTKRPTFNEVKRVHSLLTTVHVYESVDDFLTAHSHFGKKSKGRNSNNNSPSKAKNKKGMDRAKSRSPKRREDPVVSNPTEDSSEDNNAEVDLIEEDVVVDFSELKEYDDSVQSDKKAKVSKRRPKKPKETFTLSGPIEDLVKALESNELEAFQNLLVKMKESTEPVVLSQPIDIQQSTLLHLAAKNNRIEIVWSLLDAGCDPAVKDKSGKYSYNCAETRECRDTFRRFMGDHPEKFDYKKAQIPPPLSEDMEKERAEKKKQLNKLKREKEKQKKLEKMAREKETEEQTRFLNLSDREKRALAAEQRILAQCKRNAEKAPVLVRCFECAADMTGKVPFEYNQNVFCTTKCLAAHRKKFPCPLSV